MEDDLEIRHRSESGTVFWWLLVFLGVIDGLGSLESDGSVD